jgi:hypothetical protein
MRKRDEDAYAQAIVERNEARAEGSHPEISGGDGRRLLYRGDARAALIDIMTLRAMVALGADREVRGEG